MGNAGDCRAVLLRSPRSIDRGRKKSGGGEVVPLSTDHKPEDESERRRIEAADGFVTEGRRVKGVLALARSLGDASLQPAVTHEPEIRAIKLTQEDTHVVMGCDGVWDLLSNDDVLRIVTEMSDAAPAAIAARIRDAAVLL